MDSVGIEVKDPPAGGGWAGISLPEISTKSLKTCHLPSTMRIPDAFPSCDFQLIFHWLVISEEQ